MDLDELKSRYRSIKPWKRLILIIGTAIAPAGLTLWTDGEAVLADKADAIDRRETAERRFRKAKERKESLPALEEKLAATETQMESAKKKLPDEFYMDRVLQKTAMIAQDTGVELRAFDPGKGIPSDTAYKYVEMPIRLDVIGSFGQIATFYDRLVHLELLVHIRGFDLRLAPFDAKDIKNLSKEQAQEQRRTNARIQATADMIIFRSLNATESAAIAAAQELESGKKKKGKKKKGKKKKKKKSKDISLNLGGAR